MPAFHIEKEGVYENNGWIFEIENFNDEILKFPADSENTAYVDLSGCEFSLGFDVRARKDGDIITPLGSKGSQKLKKYLNAKKFLTMRKII